MANFGRKIVLRERRLDPRDEIAAIGVIVGVLELAAGALREMAARRLLVVGPERKRAVVEQCIARNSERHMLPAHCYPVAARGNADDQLAHRETMAAGMASTRASAMSCGPAISAARPWIQTPADAASKASSPRARIAAISPASTSPAPAPESEARQSVAHL